MRKTHGKGWQDEETRRKSPQFRLAVVGKGYGGWWLAVGRGAKGDFYIRKHFMDCVEGLGWCFQSLWIAKGWEMGFVVDGLGGVNGLAGNSLVLEVIRELGRGMGKGCKEGGNRLAIDRW